MRDTKPRTIGIQNKQGEIESSQSTTTKNMKFLAAVMLQRSVTLEKQGAVMLAKKRAQLKNRFVMTRRIKEPRGKRTVEEEEEEERKIFKYSFTGLEAQRAEMRTFMNTFNKNQEQQLATMNALVGALTNFLQKNNGK